MPIYFPDKLSSSCPENHFTCLNLKCVTGDSMCDGDDDCGDNSDETIGCQGKVNKLMHGKHR